MEKKQYEIYAPISSEIIVKKSRFIGESYCVHSEEEVNEIVAAIKKKHFDARHHCYAYCLDDENKIRFSDDGEPSGTAGKPILDVILGANMIHTLVVVIRYFGGTLLGTGGLTRAYAQAAKDTIKASTKIQRSIGCLAQINVGYNHIGKVENLLRDNCATTIEIEYKESIKILFLADAQLLSQIERRLLDISSGSLKIEKLESKVYGLVNNKVVWL